MVVLLANDEDDDADSGYGDCEAADADSSS